MLNKTRTSCSQAASGSSLPATEVVLGPSRWRPSPHPGLQTRGRCHQERQGSPWVTEDGLSGWPGSSWPSHCKGPGWRWAVKMKHGNERGLGPVKNNDLQVFGIHVAALRGLPAVPRFAVCSALSPNYSGLLIRDAKLRGIYLLWKWSAKWSFCLGFEEPFSYSEGILCFRRNETRMLGIYRHCK